MKLLDIHIFLLRIPASSAFLSVIDHISKLHSATALLKWLSYAQETKSKNDLWDQ